MREMKHLPKTFQGSGWFKMIALLVFAILMIKYYEQKPDDNRIKKHLTEAKETVLEIQTEAEKATTQSKTSTSDFNLNIAPDEHPIGRLVNKYMLPKVQERLEQEKIRSGLGDTKSTDREKIIDFVTGEGPKVVCGQTVTLHYEITTDRQTIIRTTKKDNKPISFVIGSNTLSPFVEREIIGMQQGGWRQIALPTYLTLYNESKQKQFTSTNVELINIDPEAGVPVENIKIYDKIPGSGPIIHCGETATINYTIKSIKNEVLKTSRTTKEPLKISPGKNEYFYGLEYSVQGMRKGGIRTAIIPPELQKHLGSSDNTQTLLPKDLKENIVIDIELVDITTN